MQRLFVLGIMLVLAASVIGCGSPAPETVASSAEPKQKGEGIHQVDKAREVAGQADARTAESDAVPDR